MKRRVGIIGCGVIGSSIAQAIIEEIGELELAACADIDSEKAQRLVNRFPGAIIKVLSNEELIEEVDLVIEAASQDAVRTLARAAIEAGKDLLVMSIGGLLEDRDLIGLARQKGTKIYLPSGAIAGLDAIKAAKCGRIEKVLLRTTKPPAGLAGAPYITRRRLDLSSLKERTTIFEGSAIEAVREFPANINVAAALSLAGIGPSKTRVEIIADPDSKVNLHEILVEGDFGRISIRCENLPSASNPKTSYLAVLSAIATLKGIVNPLKIGT